MSERSTTLGHATQVVFVLMTVLPLLVFTWTLHRLQALQSHEGQIGLGLSLALALAGFFVFRALMSRLAEVVQGLTKAAQQAARLRQAGVRSAPVERRSVSAPVVGTISELDDLASAMAAVWQREAVPHVGERVLVSVVRSTEPIPGMLKQVTDAGLLLEQDGKQIAIGYQRIAGIERAEG